MSALRHLALHRPDPVDDPGLLRALLPTLENLELHDLSDADARRAADLLGDAGEGKLRIHAVAPAWP